MAPLQEHSAPQESTPLISGSDDRRRSSDSPGHRNSVKAHDDQVQRLPSNTHKSAGAIGSIILCDDHSSASAVAASSSAAASGSTRSSISSVGAAATRPPLNTWQLLCLTVLLAGIQFVWTVELGYGTPYLLSLGLSKPLMTLVWMAGPLSGLFIQPIVGGLSDKCYSKLGRRRPYIIGGAVFVVVSVFMIAYAKEIATALAHLIYGASSLESLSFITRASIVLAVLGFYILDFSINTSQACARALALDIPPLEQQDLSNAYAGRMLNFGSVSGYMMGFLDLRALVPWKADSQMQALCVIAIVIFVLTITCTCVFVKEIPVESPLTNEGDSKNDVPSITENGEIIHSPPQSTCNGSSAPKEPWYQTLVTILNGFVNLPEPVQRVCNVQFFAWVSWFPFLFFATTWVIEIMSRTGDPTDPEFVDRATRAGSFALFLYSIASLGFSVVLPYLVADDSSDREFVDQQQRSEDPGVHGNRWLQKLRCITLRKLWAISLVAMGGILLSTFFVSDLYGATIIIIAMAFPWSLAMWAPFALVGEYVTIASTTATVATSSDTPSEQNQLSTSSGDGYSYPEDDESYIPRAHTTWRDSVGTVSMSGAVRKGGRGESIASTLHGAAEDDGLGIRRGGRIGRRPARRLVSTSSFSSETSSAANAVISTTGIKGDLADYAPTANIAESALGNSSSSSSNDNGSGNGVLEAGTILGIHNMYVVFPQFLINGLSSLIFAIFGAPPSGEDSGTPPKSSVGVLSSAERMAMDIVVRNIGEATSSSDGEVVGWVLRVGGVSALVAAGMTFLLYNRAKVRQYVESTH